MNHPKARNTDPQTSKQAAIKSDLFSGSHREKIMQALKNFGPMSPAEIAEKTGMTIVQIDRRRSEMLLSRTIRKHKIDGQVVVRCGCEVLEIV